MAIKKHKPTSPGRRFATWLQHEAVTKTEPERSLVEGLRKSGGRNNNGRVNLETDDDGSGTGDDDLTVTFNLTAIPDGSTITAATLSVWWIASDDPGALKAGSNGGGNDSILRVTPR